MLLMHETVVLNHRDLQVQFIIYHLWMEACVVRSQLAQHKVWKIKSPAFMYNLLFLSQNIIPFDLHWTLDLDKHALVLLSFMSPWDLYPRMKPTLILFALEDEASMLVLMFQSENNLEITIKSQEFIFILKGKVRWPLKVIWGENYFIERTSVISCYHSVSAAVIQLEAIIWESSISTAFLFHPHPRLEMEY